MSTPSCRTTSSVFERLAKPLVIMSARTKAASPIRLVCAVSASLSSNAECLGQRWNHNLLIASAIPPPKMAKAIAETARIARSGKELARLLTTSDIGRCFPVRQRRVKAANRKWLPLSPASRKRQACASTRDEFPPAARSGRTNQPGEARFIQFMPQPHQLPREGYEELEIDINLVARGRMRPRGAVRLVSRDVNDGLDYVQVGLQIGGRRFGQEAKGWLYRLLEPRHSCSDGQVIADAGEVFPVDDAVFRNVQEPLEFDFRSGGEHHAGRQQALHVERRDRFFKIDNGFRRYVAHFRMQLFHEPGSVVKPGRTLLEGPFSEAAEPQPRPTGVGRVQAEGDDSLAEQVPHDFEHDLGVFRVQLRGGAVRERSARLCNPVSLIERERGQVRKLAEFVHAVRVSVLHDVNYDIADFFVAVLRLIHIH